VQDPTFDAVENVPAPHAVQAVAPYSVPVFVLDPGGQVSQDVLPSWLWYFPGLQSMQDGTFDAVENLPELHAVQVVSPADMPVFVIDPGGQAKQSVIDDLPSSLW